MKNYEKYADELKEYKGLNFCKDFILPHILKSKDCGSMSCDNCRMLQLVWMLEDYKEPEVDWNKIEVNTPILVRDCDDDRWIKRYFAKYENEIIYAWNSGATSWSTSHITGWKCAKLAEPEVDWSKIEVDTAIYVKASKYGNWFKRHFAEYKNGKIYTWGNGLTSHDTSRMMEWKYAKLAENEEGQE